MLHYNASIHHIIHNLKHTFLILFNVWFHLLKVLTLIYHIKLSVISVGIVIFWSFTCD